MPKRNSTKLTIQAVKDFTCPHGKEYVTRWDSEIIGFGIRAFTSGAKVFVFTYRRNGQKKLVTIGRFGSLTPDQARDQAKKLAAGIVNGEDPAYEKKAKISSDKRTVAAFAELYMKDHAHKRKKPKSALNDQGLIDRHINPRLGTRPIASITRQDIKALHHAIGEAHEITANRTLALLSKMFNLAEEWGYRPEGSNPCRHVKKFSEHERERILTNDELIRLGDALEKFEAANLEYNRPFANLVRLLLHTGARLSEIVNAKWDDFDETQKNLRVPESKTGRRVIPLSENCRQILQGIGRIEGNPFVITGDGDGDKLGNVYRRWHELLKLAGIDGLRIHDLRHNFATRGAAAGHSLYMIGKILGHTNPATTKRYAHLTESPIQQSVNTVSSDIAALLTGKTQNAEVISLQRKT